MTTHEPIRLGAKYLYHKIIILNNSMNFDVSETDECASDNECHVNAQCTNTDGSYTCGCLDGYAGDGKNCTGKAWFPYTRLDNPNRLKNWKRSGRLGRLY